MKISRVVPRVRQTDDLKVGDLCYFEAMVSKIQAKYSATLV